MTKTTNYQLNQWAKTDRILMDDFNADNAIIEAALAKKPDLFLGSYQGRSKSGSNNPNTLTFPKPPLLVFIMSASGAHMIMMRGCDQCPNNLGTVRVDWSKGNTISWWGSSSAIQFDLELYHYIAFLDPKA